MNKKKIGRIIKTFCARNGFKVSTHYNAEDWQVYIEAKQLDWNEATDEAYNLTREMFFDEGLEYEYDNFILCLCHELGHLATEDTFSEEELTMLSLQREIICNGIEFSDKQIEVDALGTAYCKMEDELRATQWAVDFINANTCLIDEFWAEIQPLL